MGNTVTREHLEARAKYFDEKGEKALASITRSVIRSMSTAADDLSPKQEEYQEFFKSKLKDYNVDSPADLTEEQKKKFFNEIKEEWKGESTAGYRGLCACLASCDDAQCEEMKTLTDEEVNARMDVIAGLINTGQKFIYTSKGSIELV